MIGTDGWRDSGKSVLTAGFDDNDSSNGERDQILASCSIIRIVSSIFIYIIIYIHLQNVCQGPGRPGFNPRSNYTK